MPGSGKSTVGELVAERLGLRFVDLDALVSDEAGRSVAEIFELEGEPGFRRRELDALSQLVESGEPAVVATGGGVVTTAEARDVLSRTTCIWLDTSRGVLIDRLQADSSTRPLLAADLEASVHRLADEREGLYRSLGVHAIVTDGADPDDLAEQIVQLAG
jgi:shikimate kinase